MGYSQMNLQTFTIDKNNIKEGLVELFDLDSDYNGDNGDEYWEMSEQDDENGDPISLAVIEGFETEAERLVDNIYNKDLKDKTKIEETLEHIDEFCHDSFSSSFKYQIMERDSEYIVSVSYLT